MCFVVLCHDAWTMKSCQGPPLAGLISSKDRGASGRECRKTTQETMEASLIIRAQPQPQLGIEPSWLEELGGAHTVEPTWSTRYC